MIAITKAEKEAIATMFPNVHIVRTMKQKSKRHHYYCEESRSVMRFLNSLNSGEADINPREGVKHTYRKKRNRDSV